MSKEQGAKRKGKAKRQKKNFFARRRKQVGSQPTPPSSFRSFLSQVKFRHFHPLFLTTTSNRQQLINRRDRAVNSEHARSNKFR
jgi:hypothetical protein